mmetsp:Transcript_14314/g.39522  ORF Transcript_14314/g.39522 Transcript_14314/m.39522 type:complete len:256 (-) Transcript_14314:150-917(-)
MAPTPRRSWRRPNAGPRSSRPPLSATGSGSACHRHRSAARLRGRPKGILGSACRMDSRRQHLPCERGCARLRPAVLRARSPTTRGQRRGRRGHRRRRATCARRRQGSPRAKTARQKALPPRTAWHLRRERSACSCPDACTPLRRRLCPPAPSHRSKGTLARRRPQRGVSRPRVRLGAEATQPSNPHRAGTALPQGRVHVFVVRGSTGTCSRTSDPRGRARRRQDSCASSPRGRPLSARTTWTGRAPRRQRRSSPV